MFTVGRKGGKNKQGPNDSGKRKKHEKTKRRGLNARLTETWIPHSRWQWNAQSFCPVFGRLNPTPLSNGLITIGLQENRTHNHNHTPCTQIPQIIPSQSCFLASTRKCCPDHHTGCVIGLFLSRSSTGTRCSILFPSHPVILSSCHLPESFPRVLPDRSCHVTTEPPLPHMDPQG